MKSDRHLLACVICSVAWGSACAALPGTRQQEGVAGLALPAPAVTSLVADVEPVQPHEIALAYAPPNGFRPMSPRVRGTKSLPLRLVVSIQDRVLAAVVGRDTIFMAPVGVASGMTLRYGGGSWRFHTPRGSRRVLRKTDNPVWTPPDWHYAEVARANGLRVARLPAAGVALSGGRRLTVRGKEVGLILPGEGFMPLPADEHIVFGETLYAPPLGTVNRRVQGELGAYALDLGDGYMIHGTWDESTVGQASTHGCLRMREGDIEWLFDNVPVGTQVVIR